MSISHDRYGSLVDILYLREVVVDVFWGALVCVKRDVTVAQTGFGEAGIWSRSPVAQDSGLRLRRRSDRDSSSSTSLASSAMARARAVSNGRWAGRSARRAARYAEGRGGAAAATLRAAAGLQGRVGRPWNGRTTSIGWRRSSVPSLHPSSGMRQTCPRPPLAVHWRYGRAGHRRGRQRLASPTLANAA